MDDDSLREISRSGEESAEFEWRISKWGEELRRNFLSPDFSFAGAEWRLKMVQQRGGRVSKRILLYRFEAFDKTVRCGLGIRTADGGEESLGDRLVEPGKYGLPSWRLGGFVSHEERLVPLGTLTLLVRMRIKQDKRSSQSPRPAPSIDSTHNKSQKVGLMVPTVIDVSSDDGTSAEEGAHFEWPVARYREKIGHQEWSPTFSLAETRWILKVEFQTLSWIRVFLYRLEEASDHQTTRAWLGIKRADGGEEEIGNCTVELANYVDPSWALLKVGEREKQLAPCGTLTFLLRLRTGSETEREKKVEEEIASYEQVLDIRKEKYAKLKQWNVELGTNLNAVQQELRDLQKQHDSSVLELQATKRKYELFKQEKKNLADPLEERRAEIKKLRVEVTTETEFDCRCPPEMSSTDRGKGTSRPSSCLSSHLDDLSRDLGKLLEDGALPDVKLICGDRKIAAHRAILAARSAVFSDIFRSRSSEDEIGAVDITDIDDQALELFLNYVYTGRVVEIPHNALVDLYEASDSYAISGLKKECSERIIKDLTQENCLHFLLLADSHGDQEFKDAILDFILNNVQILEREEWNLFCTKNLALSNEVFRMVVRRKIFN